MKKLLVTILLLATAMFSHAGSIFRETFEFANHDGATPLGWITDNETWLCGYLDKDHNRMAHTGDWYAYTNSDRSWMFMPMNMNPQLKYRFSLWAISDGGYQLEIWAGNEASPSAMTQLLLHDIVSSGTYEQFSVYVDEVTSNYEYFGIYAVQSYCGDCLLTIDDINVDMVEKYALHASPTETDTIMHAGVQVPFKCKVSNDGYEPLNVLMTPNTEYFTDIHFYIEGQQTNTFHFVQDEVVIVRGVATLRPDVEPGSRCWFDVIFTIDCGCATAMYTYWATVATDGMVENLVKPSIYPNPSTGLVTIEGMGMMTITNTLGQVVLQKEIIDNETVTLDKGIYFVKIDNCLTEKIVIK